MAHRIRALPNKIAEGLRLTLTGIAHGGEAIGRHKGEVVFVAGGIPGEEISVDLYRERPGLLRGTIRDVLLPSSHRVTPPCPYFGYCGGCQWQHIAYGRQLALKARIVAEQLQHIGGLSDPAVCETLASPKQWHYRNHVRFSAGRHGHLGFTRPRSHRFLAVDRCLIAHPKINDVLHLVQGRGSGLHQVVMRVGENTGNFLLYPPLELPHRSTVSHTELHEQLLGHRFYVSLSSFFQVNTVQAERLARLVIERLALTGREVVIDAYCGVGTFAILLAEHARRVIGVEESSSAIKNAKRNAAESANVSFVAAKTEDALPKLAEQVDAVVLDPARAGCAPAVIDALARLHPAKIVYVSCDPATLARDLRLLCQCGYRLAEVQPVDMFPQTYHIESVATLLNERADG